MIIVLPNKYTRGYNGEPLEGSTASGWLVRGTIVPTHSPLSLQTALQARSPAHLCMYGLPDRGVLPRLNKSSLTNPTGATLNALIVDVDHEGHTVPPPDWHAHLLQLLKGTPFDNSYWYRTEHGLRLCWTLQRAIPLELADSYIRQAFDALRALGVPADASCQDWTRLNRAPDAGLGLPMDVAGDRPPLAWEAPEPLTEEVTSAAGVALDVPRPEIQARLTREALKPLKSIDASLADSLYQKTLPAAVGERHATILRIATTIVWAYETNNPVVPYSLLLPASLAAGKGEAEVWSICQWAAAAYDGAQITIAAERKSSLQAAAEAMGASEEEVTGRLIVDTGAEQYVWSETANRYMAGCTHQHQLLGMLDRYCPSLLPEYYTSFATAMRAHSFPVAKVVYTYDQATRGVYHDSMHVPVCRRDSRIVAKYHEGVDEWLNGTFGQSEHGEHFFDWLAGVYDITRPTCAVYIEGPPGIGKNLLVQGIARAYGPEKPTVEFASLLQNFNQPILDSPIVVADEALPRNARGSATLRQYIGNTGWRVNAKYRTEATIQGYPRILLLANNDNILEFSEDMSPDDMDAIRIRIGHIRVPESATGFLEQMAARRGLKTARQLVDPWVQQGAIAAHVLWLAETRNVQEGSRFLVEGWKSEMSENLPASSGSVEVVISAIVSAISAGRWSDAVRWWGGNVYVHNPSLAAEWDLLMPGERTPLNKSRLRTLRTLSRGKRKILDTPSTRKRRQLQYFQIPGHLVVRLGTETGDVPSSVLAEAIARPSETLNQIDEDALGVLQ